MNMDIMNNEMYNAEFLANPYTFEKDGAEVVGAHQLGFKNGAEKQKAIDHSEEHLNWIIKQHYQWSYEMCHCDNNECCTFKEWVDKAMEGKK